MFCICFVMSLNRTKNVLSDNCICITNLLPEGTVSHFAFPLCNRPDFKIVDKIIKGGGVIKIQLLIMRSVMIM